MDFALLNIFIAIGSKGISSHLWKATAKRRRSKAQIKDEEKMEKRKQKEVAEKLARFAEMEEKVKVAETLHAEKEHYRQILGGMYENGVIK